MDVYLSFNSKRGEINATWVKVALSPKTLPDCPQIAADRIEKALEDNTLVALVFLSLGKMEEGQCFGDCEGFAH